MDYCENLSPAQLMQLWWIYQNKKRCLKIFSEWCFAKAVTKLECLEMLHADKRKFLKRAEKVMTKYPKNMPTWCEGINLKHTKLKYSLREGREIPLLHKHLLQPSVTKELVEEFI